MTEFINGFIIICALIAIFTILFSIVGYYEGND